MPSRVSIESYCEDVDCSILVGNATFQVPGPTVAELTNCQYGFCAYYVLCGVCCKSATVCITTTADCVWDEMFDCYYSELMLICALHVVM